ncbi:hypothetical protein C9381_10180 [Pantoea vagans]|uniref:Uncharacterized protein n=2 Tax=Erwiniaceae TaxID=1903409 RepID=A0AAN1NQM1_9GAMM|nr:hypothetical protein C9381_10180 [Pantoea vagans]
MQCNHLFNGRLTRSPFAFRAYRANDRVLPLTTPEDYASLGRIKKPAVQSPVLCGFQEKYDLLEEIVNAAFSHLQPLDRCVMTAMMPGGLRLPARLLQDDIFLLHQVEQEAKRLFLDGYSVLAIEESMIRHPLESGSNHLLLRWFPQHSPQRQDGWDELVRFLHQLNIVAIDA